MQRLRRQRRLFPISRKALACGFPESIPLPGNRTLARGG
jgi:hypothetical protein